MTHIEPTLVTRQVKAAAPEAVERITSFRSYAERKEAYQRLINVEMPENAKRIEFARSYGDLSENAEYQYAKDEQRALMQKQDLMQAEIEAVKPTDFADVAADLVRPGTTVTITAADGAEKVYTVLGEWDNDLERGIIANKTRLAQNMLGKKPGDTFDLPDAEGNVSVATIKSIAPLSDEMRAWVQVPPGLSI
jgi:transcription elongation factor GreA